MPVLYQHENSNSFLDISLGFYLFSLWHLQYFLNKWRYISTNKVKCNVKIKGNFILFLRANLDFSIEFKFRNHTLTWCSLILCRIGYCVLLRTSVATFHPEETNSSLGQESHVNSFFLGVQFSSGMMFKTSSEDKEFSGKHYDLRYIFLCSQN